MSLTHAKANKKIGADPKPCANAYPMRISAPSRKVTRPSYNEAKDVAHLYRWGWNILVVKFEESYLAMLNPEIVKKSAKAYKTSEGCLSLAGERETVRHDWIEIKYRDMDFRKQKQKFVGFAAQIIQHEIDHCNGILI